MQMMAKILQLTVPVLVEDDHGDGLNGDGVELDLLHICRLVFVVAPSHRKGHVRRVVKAKQIVTG